MATRREEEASISIADAIETLSNISELDGETTLGITDEHRLVIQGEEVKYHTVQWLGKGSSPETVKLVKETFRVVLVYLQNFYETEYEHLHKRETIEEIKTIMVLVGEAAQKLDKYTAIFKEKAENSVTQLKEYRQLQNFYKTKIAKRIEESFLRDWVKQLPQMAPRTAPTVKLRGKGKISTKRVWVDLEAVKKDTVYELFFIRKENGDRFLSPKLIRNIKLVLDFGEAFGKAPTVDPLLKAQRWLDKSLHVAATEILESLGSTLDFYCREIMKDHEVRLISCLNRTLMALMLSANSRNLLSNAPAKSCHQYFLDFQTFLREAINTRWYKKMLAYPPAKEDTTGTCLVELIHKICFALFAKTHSQQAVDVVIEEIIDKNREDDHQTTLAGHLNANYRAIGEVIKRHPTGPLQKALEQLETFGDGSFDTLMQNNIPNHLFDLYLDKKRVSHYRIPSPTHQEVIDKASITGEFRGFLRANPKKHHLLINLQDRTSWQEHQRCHALEEFHKHPDFRELLTTVTLARDTDFYHQVAPYHNINHADAFIHHFIEHLKGAHSGFYFPIEIKRELMSGWVDKVLEGIHQFFFSGKNVLSRNSRMDFIEIFYVLLELKLIEMTKADSFSLTCKDTIDNGATATAELYIFSKLMNEKGLSDSDIKELNTILFTLPLMLRERHLMASRFDRLLSVTRLLENMSQELGHEGLSQGVTKTFGKLFEKSTLGAEIEKKVT